MSLSLVGGEGFEPVSQGARKAPRAPATYEAAPWNTL